MSKLKLWFSSTPQAKAKSKMAKSKYSGKAIGDNPLAINEYLSELTSDGMILAESKNVEIRDWIDLGSKLMNAQVSGSTTKGAPSGRIFLIAGDPKTGKSYVVLNGIRNAIEQGYFVMFWETEFSPDLERFKKQHIDPNKVRIFHPETVGEVAVGVANVTRDLIKRKAEGFDIPKICFAIDSLSALFSTKILGDLHDTPSIAGNKAEKGQLKSDMGFQAKELGVLMSLLSKRCGKLDIPVFCTAHVYEEQIQNFKRKKVSAGMKPLFFASVIMILSKAVEKNRANGERLGIIVTSELMESRFTIPKPIKAYISYQNGMNPYFGLETYVTWNSCGIDKGKFAPHVDLAHEFFTKKLLTKETIVDFEFDEAFMKTNLGKAKYEEVDFYLAKMLKDGLIEKSGKPEEKKYKFTKVASLNFTAEGKYPKSEEMVPMVNPLSNQYIVKHLGEVLPNTGSILNSRVFTNDVLHELDENIMRPCFELPNDMNAIDIPYEELLADKDIDAGLAELEKAV